MLASVMRRFSLPLTLGASKCGCNLVNLNIRALSSSSVDLRSDTVTKPTAGMLQAMSNAEVGDDVYREDPTVVELESRVATLLGKQDSLWVPSGTMANMVAILANCSRGDQVIMGSASHVWLWEQHGLSSLGGLAMHPLPNEPSDGSIPIAMIQESIHSVDDHLPRSRMVVLENTQSGCGGIALDPSYVSQVAKFCKAQGMLLHIDGARLLNASVALGIPPDRLSADADSVCICLSKGVGAPMGSVVAGGKDTIANARRVRKSLGGGLRQVGVVAAAGLYGLERYQEVMTRDHARARALAAGLAGIEGIRVAGNWQRGVMTNMVIFGVDEQRMTAAELCESVEKRGVLMWPYGRRGNDIRAVLHLGVTDQGVERALSAVKDVMNQS